MSQEAMTIEAVASQISRLQFMRTFNKEFGEHPGFLNREHLSAIRSAATELMKAARSGHSATPAIIETHNPWPEEPGKTFFYLEVCAFLSAIDMPSLSLSGSSSSQSTSGKREDIVHNR